LAAVRADRTGHDPAGRPPGVQDGVGGGAHAHPAEERAGACVHGGQQHRLHRRAVGDLRADVDLQHVPGGDRDGLLDTGGPVLVELQLDGAVQRVRIDGAHAHHPM